MAITPDIVTLIRTYLTDPGIRIPDLPNGVPEPLIATIREVDIEIKNSVISVFYSKANYEVFVADYGGLNGLLAEIVADNLAMDAEQGPKSPYSSKLSLQNDKYCYLIFKLSGKNWQFSHDKDPFSVGLDSLEPEAYYSARRVDKKGKVVGKDKIKDDCKVAFFIANGKAANSGFTGIYTDPFNLHLELLDVDSDGNLSRMPIIVDPDVRYPGGSGPDDGGP